MPLDFSVYPSSKLFKKDVPEQVRKNMSKLK